MEDEHSELCTRIVEFKFHGMALVAPCKWLPFLTRASTALQVKITCSQIRGTLLTRDINFQLPLLVSPYSTASAAGISSY